MRKLCLPITRQLYDVAERLAVEMSFWDMVRAIGALEEVNEVVNGRVEELQIRAKIEPQDTGVLQEPVLRLLGVFGMAECVGYDHGGNATRPKQLKPPFNERNIQIPLFPQRFVLPAV